MRKRILIVLLATALNIVSMILISLTNLQTTGYILSGIGLVLILREIKATSKNAWWNY